MRYAYFDSEITGVDDEGMPIFDRAENSEMLAMIFSRLVTNGVLARPADSFQVLAGSGLSVTVRPGFGVINGRFAYETEETPLNLTAASSQYSRIDRIVLRCNYLERMIELAVKAGTPAANPVAPELLQPSSGDYYELGLATVKIAPNQAAISQSNITDTRGDSSVCGLVTQFIDRLDTEVFFAQLNSFYANYVQRSNSQLEDLTTQAQEEFSEWFDNLKDQLAEDAAGNLQNQINAQTSRLDAFEEGLADTITDAIQTANHLQWRAVESLPAAADAEDNVVYAIPSGDSSGDDRRREYILAYDSSGNAYWETWGASRVDLSGYYTKTETDSKVPLWFGKDSSGKWGYKTSATGAVTAFKSTADVEAARSAGYSSGQASIKTQTLTFNFGTISETRNFSKTLTASGTVLAAGISSLAWSRVEKNSAARPNNVTVTFSGKNVTVNGYTEIQYNPVTLTIKVNVAYK